jgi:formylglycine-generating enzyme required for sulfatase activity
MLGLEPWPELASVVAKVREQHLPEDFEGRLRALRAAASVRPDYRALDGRLIPVAAELVQQAEAERRAAALSTQALVWARSGRLTEALAALDEARAAAGAADAQQLERDAALVTAQVAAWDVTQRAAREQEHQGLRVQLDEAQNALQAENTRVRALCETRRTWRYSDSQTQWWHDQLVLLHSELELLHSLLQYAQLTTRRPEAVQLWADVAADVATNPRYAGVQWPSGRLTPQLGLLPLGKCPQSGLWEFVHLQSGDAPLRNADGTLELRPEVGLVFVLLPGGRVPREDHAGGELARQWAPLTEVDLVPYFLAKYEMTQAQWNRVSEWQGKHAEPDPLHPANFISWQQCQATFTRCLGWVDLPTEAQWELACRAGTTTAWWTGTTESSLEGAAQVDGLHDVAAEFVHMLPVGSLRPNPFGLHDMHGNVWEWCKDTFSGITMRALDGDHTSDREGGADRIFRGGSYLNSPSFARAGFRFSYAPGRRLPTLGLRPAMAVLP